MAAVVILGAGFAGCATGWALARRGVASVILEREPELGRYASGRGAGLGRQLCEDDATSRLAMRGAHLLRTELAAAWSPTGGTLCFEDAALAAEYIARAQRLPLEFQTTASPLPHLPVATSLHVPSDGVIDAALLLRMFAENLDIRLGVGATRLEPGRVETTAGPLDAKVVVDATGAWAGALTGDVPLESFKRHLFVVAGPATDGPYIWYVGAREHYFRADGPNTLVSPCDAEVTAAADQQPSLDADERLAARYPGARILRRWACQRAFAPDRLMRLGRDPSRPWLVWAAALGGHGATASPAVGEAVADAVLQAL